LMNIISVDYRMQKEDAQRFIQNASVIFLCGGDPVLQNDFLAEYELSDVIKNSDAVIMGASAGALNMAAQWLSLNDHWLMKLKRVLFMMVLALIILPMNLILNATTPRLFKATCSPCLKRLMFMRQNRRALYV
jgi:cyanophycinase-like exopeptidase